MLKRFIGYYKPHKKLFVADIAASLFISAIGMVYPIITNLMLNKLIPDKKYKMIIIAGAVVLLLYIIRTLLRYFVQYYGHLIGTRMQAQMRSDMFRHLQTLPYKY
jgi:ATP-binding cassette subfamily B protein